MYDVLTEHVKQAAYFQWEETGCYGSALEHWHCVEDIACFLEGNGVLNEEDLMMVLKNAKRELSYENFVREMAFRLSFYSGAKDAETNWYSAEQLLHNSEWRRAITQAAKVYSLKKGDPEFLKHIRSESVRDYYRI